LKVKCRASGDGMGQSSAVSLASVWSLRIERGEHAAEEKGGVPGRQRVMVTKSSAGRE
jgi:hypothetical protein